MRRFAKVLKVLFAVPDVPRLPTTASEMTLHDAMRICSGEVRIDGGSASPQADWRKTGVYRYRSEADLHDQWRRLDDVPAANLTVILVLDDLLRGSLRNVIRRRQFARRLVIVPDAGYWPGKDSFGDLALSAGSLGWSSIEICRDLRHALLTSAVESRHDEQLVLVMPPTTSVPNVH